MALSLSTDLTVRLAATLTNPLDLSTPTDALVDAIKVVLTSGTGANQADRIFHDTRTLSASATENLDLAGSLTGPLGSTVTFAKIKLVLVTAAAANTNSVQVTREGTNGVPLFMALGDGIALRPGAGFLWWNPDSTGVAVTASTGDLLTITNSAGSTSVDYSIVIIGTSA